MESYTAINRLAKNRFPIHVKLWVFGSELHCQIGAALAKKGERRRATESSLTLMWDCARVSLYSQSLELLVPALRAFSFCGRPKLVRWSRKEEEEQSRAEQTTPYFRFVSMIMIIIIIIIITKWNCHGYSGINEQRAVKSVARLLPVYIMKWRCSQIARASQSSLPTSRKVDTPVDRRKTQQTWIWMDWFWKRKKKHTKKWGINKVEFINKGRDIKLPTGDRCRRSNRRRAWCLDSKIHFFFTGLLGSCETDAKTTIT
jgi:hypothetical protein